MTEGKLKLNSGGRWIIDDGSNSIELSCNTSFEILKNGSWESVRMKYNTDYYTVPRFELTNNTIARVN